MKIRFWRGDDNDELGVRPELVGYATVRNDIPQPERFWDEEDEILQEHLARKRPLGFAPWDTDEP